MFARSNEARAIAVRLRRVYLWLVAATYTAWFIIKLGQLGHLPESANMQKLGGLLVIAIGLLPLVVALGLTFYVVEE